MALLLLLDYEEGGSHMKVKMKVQTRYDGQALTKGDVIDVPEDVATRWKQRGIAILGKKDKDSTGEDLQDEGDSDEQS